MFASWTHLVRYKANYSHKCFWKVCRWNNFDDRAAAIAPWFCLYLPSCGPGFESQAHHLCFFNLYY